MTLAGILLPGATAGHLEPAAIHRERPDDPPAPLAAEPPATLIIRSGPVTRGTFQSVQVNVDAFGQNIPGDAANEPSIAVDPTDPDKIAIGWRQFDSVQSNFRQAGVGHSSDGGATWSAATLDPNNFRSDPVLDFDADGNFYYNSLKADFRCDVFISTDGGATWSPPMFAYGGDKNWMTIDRTGGIGNGHIYTYWSVAGNNYYPAQFARSVTGGLTFETPVTMAADPIWGTLAVDRFGHLYLAGVNPSGMTDYYVLKSTNARIAAFSPTFTVKVVDLGGSIQVATGPNPGGLLGQVWIATDNSDGPNQDNVYVLGSVDRPGSDPLDVMFIRSMDGGATWSAPVRVNDDPPGTNAWQWFGTMSVAPSGRIDVIWNDTRADPGATYSELYYAYSTDAGRTWSANVPLSPPFNHFLGYPRQNKLGDYYHMISDEAGARIAYAATFNGEQDVYFLRLAIDCNGNGIHDADELTPDPTIAEQPAGSEACEGSTVTFTVGVDGTPPLSYQWRKDGQDITGAVDSAYTIEPVGMDGAGEYDVVVTNVCGSATSEPASLAVLAAPAGPTDALSDPPATCSGEPATLSASAGELEIDWYAGSCGGPLVGTGDSISVSPEATTTYYARSRDGASGCESLDCAAVTVTANRKPAVPADATASPAAVCEGESTMLTASAGGADIDWFAGGCGGTYVATGGSVAVSPETTTSYYARAIDGATGCESSSCAAVAVTVHPARPTITRQPGDEQVCAGEEVTFRIGAASASTLRYAWFKDGAPVGDNGPTLVLAEAQLADDGAVVTCAVSDDCGTAESQAAVLSVVKPALWYRDADGDGFGDAGDPVADCSQPLGFVANDQDCDDGDSSYYPGAAGLGEGCDSTLDFERCHEDIIALATTASGANVEFIPPKVAGGFGEVVLSCDHASGEFFPIGETLVSCAASDEATARTVICAFAVRVVAPGDPTLAPTSHGRSPAEDACGGCGAASPLMAALMLAGVGMISRGQRRGRSSRPARRHN